MTFTELIVYAIPMSMPDVDLLSFFPAPLKASFALWWSRSESSGYRPAPLQNVHRFSLPQIALTKFCERRTSEPDLD